MVVANFKEFVQKTEKLGAPHFLKNDEVVVNRKLVSDFKSLLFESKKKVKLRR